MPKMQRKMETDFTMAHNAFLKDKRLGSSERGILITMLSKPSDYNFTIRGLASEMADGVSSISSALNKLEKFGYIKRNRKIVNGKFCDMEYYFSDEPIYETEFNNPEKIDEQKSDTEKPYTGKPNTGNPYTEKPCQENPYDLVSTDKLSTDRVSTKEINKEKEKKKPIEQKKQFAEAVYLTDSEYQTLCEKHPKTFVDKCINVLNNYKLSKGKYYKSDYHAILAWVEKKVLEDMQKIPRNQVISAPIQTDPHENPFAKYLNQTGGQQCQIL